MIRKAAHHYWLMGGLFSFSVSDYMIARIGWAFIENLFYDKS